MTITTAHTRFPSGSSTLIELLRTTALHNPDRQGYTFLLNGETDAVSLTYGELDRQARSIAALLQQARASGERALLLYPPGLEYIAAFFGCLYAGVVAVPAYPPRLNRNLDRLQTIVKDAQPGIALTTGSLLASMRQQPTFPPDLAALRWHTTDTVPAAAADDWQPPAVSPDTLAFLQYTSGSTGAPKGVMLTHGNLLHNSELIRQSFEHTPESRGCIWLPPYHDMGLIGGIVQPLYAGFPVTLMSPTAFLQAPIRWLQAISRTRATTSGGPNFAYDLCIRKVTPEQRAALDLSSWDVAFTGAEPVRAETLERFAAVFAECGFRREAFYPCYGLAEATLIVTGGAKRALPTSRTFDALALEKHQAVEAVAEDTARTLIGCGHAMSGQQAIVVDPETGNRQGAGQIGEVWVSGPSVAHGYWNQPAATEQTFGAYLVESGAGPFLRTGDLGFLHEGELFVTGRIKDLIIIRGRNYYPQDIEQTVEQSHAALRAGSGAAFSVDLDDHERLVVVQEVERHYRHADVAPLIAAIRRAVAVQHELQVYAVVLLKPGSIPKTSSGKIQRHACRAAFNASTFDELGRSVLDPALSEEVEQAALTRTALLERDPADRARPLEQQLQERVARALRVAPEQVDLHQPLIDLGLDSLMALEVQHALEADFGVAMPMTRLLEGACLAEIVPAIIDRIDISAANDERASAPGVSTVYDLSVGQRALWFLHQVAPESPAYNLFGAVRIHAELNVPAFQRAFRALVERHAALRTRFVMAQGEPKQRIEPDAESYLLVEDATALSEAVLNQRVAEEAHRPFQLDRGPLVRGLVFVRGAHEYLFLLVAHHSIADFWSLAILVQELGALYAAEHAGRPHRLAPLTFHYADYVRAQAELLAGPAGEQLWRYWSSQLAGAPGVLNLPTDRPRPAVQTYHGATHRFSLSRDLSEQIKALAGARGATLYMVLLAAFQTILYRYTDQEDFVVGSPVAGRTQPTLAGLVGYVTNPVVLRANLSGNPTFLAVIEQARQTTLAALAHQEYPFPLLVERLEIERDPSRSPLFQVMFALQKAHTDSQGLAAFAFGMPGVALTLGDMACESCALERQIAQFDLTLTIAEVDGALAAAFQYNTDLFDTATIARLAEHFAVVLAGLVADPAVPIARLPLLTPREHALLQRWNATAADYPPCCLHELVAQQAARTPAAIAVVQDDQPLPYAALHARANQLAQYLQALGVGPEVRVAVCLERTPELVVALLAILSAGGCYVPLDPSYPAERLAFVLRDAQVALCVTQETLLARLPETGVPLVCLERVAEAVAGQPTTCPPAGVVPANLAYVIYTSGSTGTPKGVMIDHASVCNHLCWRQATFPLSQDDRFLHKASSSFDISVWEIFGTLISGAQLVLAKPGGQQDSAYLVELMAEQAITVAHVGPAMLQMILAEPHLERCASLRRIFCGGEPLSVELKNRCLARLDVELYNQYGPTEATIDATYWRCQPDAHEQTVPIGGPIANTQAYVLDQHLALVPLGVVGELYLGGAGVARGYLQRPDLTAATFVPDPFSRPAGTRPGARLYRTGDRARRRADGALEFLGRRDQQVKLRGFRIELGEIAAVLRQHAAVHEAVVLLRDDTPPAGGHPDQRLVAYVVGENHERVPAGQTQNQTTPAPRQGERGGAQRRGEGLHAELRAYLHDRLPAYMVPSAFVFLDALPLNANGKLDRGALPVPDSSRAGLAQGYVAPRTRLEAEVARIWAEVLQLDTVGVQDNFFALGGHSLLATQVLARIQATFQVQLSVLEFFESPRVGDLAAAIGRKLGAPDPQQQLPIVPVARTQRLPLSFAQQQFWFLDQYSSGAAVYTVPVAVELNGQLHREALQQSLEQLVQRHEVLRTTFARSGAAHDGELVQVIAPKLTLPLPVATLSTLAPSEQAAQVQRLLSKAVQRPFDLQRGPLVRAHLLQLAADRHVLVLTLHHSICDGWSLGVLVQDLAAFYAAAVTQDSSVALPPLPIQYADYAVWQRRWIESEVPNHQLTFWQAQLAGAPQVLDLPTDFVRPTTAAFQGASYTLRLDRQRAATLQAFCRQEGVTLFMTLLSAFAALLSRYTQQHDLLIGTPVAGRTRVETERLIGCFINTLVLRCDLTGNPTGRALLQRIRTRTLEAYANQDLPFEHLVQTLQPERSTSHLPLVQVLFVLHNAPLPPLRLSELTLELLDIERGTSKFDLMLSARETADGLRLSFEYRTDLFQLETIARLAEHFAVVLAGLVADPTVPIARLPLLTPREHALLQRWNATAAEFPPCCLHELVAQQAARTPAAIAVVQDDQPLTYAALHARANQLAHYLQALGVGPEVRVAVCLERTPELVVTLLAILSAGGCYVPLDPSYPAERLAFVLRDAQVALCVTQETLATRLPETGVPLVCLERVAEAVAGQPTTCLPAGVVPANLAYVIYTSGSTGTPKGVAIPHSSAVNLIAWAQSYFTPEQRAGVLAATSVCFDLSIFELFVPLSSGGTVILVEHALVDLSPSVADLITLVNTVPSVLDERLRLAPLPATVRAVNLAGEPLSAALAERIFQQSSDYRLSNLYGPSETTTYSTAAQIVSGDPLPPSIGGPIANTQAYVLDQHLALVPLGVVGELYLG
ncbi:MAG TPA: amino acid adenylation domain-containing protein, partial [Herpetosiphonaceae bacterium]